MNWKAKEKEKESCDMLFLYQESKYFEVHAQLYWKNSYLMDKVHNPIIDSIITLVEKEHLVVCFFAF